MTTLQPPRRRHQASAATAGWKPGVAPGRTPRRRLRRAWLTPYLLIAPFFVIFGIVGVFPLPYTFWVSLHQWNLLGGAGSARWAGWGNYLDLAADPHFWNALANTVSIWVISTVPMLITALGLAALLNARLRARTLFRMGALLPNITSVAAVAIIFSQIFGRDYGLANHLLGLVGVEQIDWQSGRLSSHVAISVMVAWRWTGYNALIYLAGMQAIPGDLYEAATIDGAGPFQRFWYVTIPALRPAIIFTVILSTIGGMQLFAEPLLFDAAPGSAFGGSDRQFQTLAVYLYQQAFREFRFGYGAAVAWSLFLIVVVASLLNYLLVRRLKSTS